jgi:hypothetical protein
MHLDDMSSHAQPSCFFVRLGPGPCASFDIPESDLAGRHADAFARLLPMLGCGEEAAALSFDRMSHERTFQAAAQYALAAIAVEERQHDSFIVAMRRALPPTALTPAIEQKARRLHMRIGRGDAVIVLARIAALDAAVCTVLNRITARHTPVSRAPGFRQTLARIRSDEARHVHATRELVLAQGAISHRALNEEASWVRQGLASLLAHENDAFETLGVDPAALQQSVRRVPDGLFRA